MAKKSGRSTDASRGSRVGLGRGLDALLGDASAAILKDETSGQGVDKAKTSPGQPGRPSATLPIELLHANPDQPRRYFNEDALAELAASIRVRGMLQPILVRPTGANAYEIVAGERRWRAAQRAQLHEVPVIVRELTDEEAAEIALIENVQRVDLNAIEEALAYQRLSDHYGRTQEQIAKAVGKSRSHVANIMRLLALPQKSLDAVRTNEITMGHARALLGAPDPDALLDIVLSRELSVRDTERLVQSSGGTSRPRAKASPVTEDAASTTAQKAGAARLKDADTRALETDLAAALGLSVSIDHERGKGGVIHISYLTLDQLDDVTRRLMGTGV
ncbi:MAG: ParB/RepB/Spo0J family partition protein [Alphaproteobacteria bacterium]|nr:ParB/RepB/Spo0J family partition protein [Alphaproteobacteria bacterium]